MRQRQAGCSEESFNIAEDTADIRAYSEALKKDDGDRLPMDDVMRMAMEAE